MNRIMAINKTKTIAMLICLSTLACRNGIEDKGSPGIQELNQGSTNIVAIDCKKRYSTSAEFTVTFSEEVIVELGDKAPMLYISFEAHGPKKEDYYQGYINAYFSGETGTTDKLTFWRVKHSTIKRTEGIRIKVRKATIHLKDSKITDTYYNEEQVSLTFSQIGKDHNCQSIFYSQ